MMFQFYFLFLFSWKQLFLNNLSSNTETNTYICTSGQDYWLTLPSLQIGSMHRRMTLSGGGKKRLHHLPLYSQLSGCQVCRDLL